MSSVQCKVNLPEGGLTVGTRFSLLCEGPWPEMKPEGLELRFEQTDKYALRLLEFKFNSKTEAELVVTSYKPGNHSIKAAQVVDAEHSVVLNDLDFTVASVINPQEPPAEPFGPFGPFLISVPLIYWLVLAAVVASVGSFFGLKIYRRNQRQKLLLAMRLTESAQTPIAQFHSSLRKLQRQFAFFAGAEVVGDEISQCLTLINDSFRLFVARKLSVPTRVWSDKLILADIQKHHRVFFEEHSKDLKKAFAELGRALKNPKTTPRDVQQIIELTRQVVDRMESHKA
jgi:hypothetical protein